MKKFILPITVLASLFYASCSEPKPQNAKEYYNLCMTDSINKIIYEDSLEAYCNCIQSKLNEVENIDSLPQDEEKAIIQSCADKYTNLDTSF